MTTTTIKIAIKKSTSFARIGVSGKMTLGKYTLPNIPWPETRLILDPVIVADMYVHGITATVENRKYGTPSVGMFATLPNIIVNITICIRGCRIAQENPMIVCA